MSAKNLTEARLSSLDQWAACDLGKSEGGEVAALIAELRELRALVNAPMPCGWPAPTAGIEASHDGRITPVVEWFDVHEQPIDPDEAIALGAALIRAALAAKGGAE